MEQHNKNPYFGFTQETLRYALTHDSKSHYLFDQLMSLSLLIRAGKGQIIKTKRFLNESVSIIKYCKLLRSYNLPNPYDDHNIDLNEIRKAIKEYTKELHMHQKDLRKIYAKHNEMVKDLKKAVNTYLSDNGCPEIKHVRQAELKDVGDIEGLPQIKEERSLTTINLSRVGVLTLIKKLTDEIKAKPNCNKFTITLKTGVTKG